MVDWFIGGGGGATLVGFRMGPLRDGVGVGRISVELVVTLVGGSG